MDKPVIIIGAGGHARVLVDTLLEMAVPILGFVEINVQEVPESMLGVEILGDERVVYQYSPCEIILVNGLGSIKSTANRRNAFMRFKEFGYGFRNVIHPSAVVSRNSRMGEGVQILAGAIVQAGVRIGDNVIVNTRASIDHDCVIGDHVHIAPGATLSGGVNVGEESHIGIGCSIIQNISIGVRGVIGAGSLVIRNVPEATVVMGVPGKEVKK